MIKNNKKIIVLYHAHCEDGFTAVYIARQVFGNRAEYLPVVLADRLSLKGFKNKEIYMLDLSYSVEETLEAIKNNKSVTLIDHHRTALEVSKIVKRGIFNMKHSGAVLAWQYFFPKKKMPRLVKYIEAGDLWNWQVRKAEEVNTYIRSVEMSYKNWDKLAREFEDNKKFKDVIKKGEMLLDYEWKMVREIVDNQAEEVELLGRRVRAVNSGVLGSKLGHALETKEIGFGLFWSKYPGYTRVSLRSSGRVDVSEMARRFGGGGHKNAAGFSIPDGQPLPWRAVKKRKK